MRRELIINKWNFLPSSYLVYLVSPAGSVIDRTAENAIRSQFEKVEQLQVRVDNAPVTSYCKARWSECA